MVMSTLTLQNPLFSSNTWRRIDRCFYVCVCVCVWGGGVVFCFVFFMFLFYLFIYFTQIEFQLTVIGILRAILLKENRALLIETHWMS